MLKELAMGDAYGAAFEYTPLYFVEALNRGDQYHQHPRHTELDPGCYTDDTQMSLALSEHIIEGDDWTPERIAERFVYCFHRDPRVGYARGFHQFLQTCRSGTDFLNRIRPYSEKNGAAMRAPPLGLFPDLRIVLELAQVQATLTHATAQGIYSSCASALMTHYFRYQLGSKRDLGAFLRTYVPGAWTEPWEGKVGAGGEGTVRAAITAIQEATSLQDLLIRCVAFRGDVDTVAAIALGAASYSPEHPNDLPSELWQNLERGPYGADYLAAVDELLVLAIDPNPLSPLSPR